MTTFKNISILLALAAAACGPSIDADSGGEGAEGESAPGDTEELAKWWAGTVYSKVNVDDTGVDAGTGYKTLTMYSFSEDGSFIREVRRCDGGGGESRGRWKVVGEDGERIDLLSEDGSEKFVPPGSVAELQGDLQFLRRYSADNGCGVFYGTDEWGLDASDKPWTRGELCLAENEGTCLSGSLPYYYCDLEPPAEPDLAPCPEQ